MGSRAFWAVVFGFFIGVTARSFLLIGWSFVLFLILIAVAIFLTGWITRVTLARVTLVGLALLSCAAGVARMQLAVVTGDTSATVNIGKSVSVQGFVFQEPDSRDTATLVYIDANELTVGDKTIPVHAGILAQMPAHARVAYGDTVQVYGTLELPEAFQTGIDREFDYPQYLAAQGIEYQLAYAQLDSISGYSGEPLQAFAIGSKENFLRGLGSVMPDPEAALAGGITVGDKRSVGPELTNDFQRDSLVHMIVLSGYNITVVLNAAARILSFAPRFAQFGGSIFVVIFFILMSGGASSATRAGLMALIATLARATHRTYLGERVLATASLLMIAWNPWTLCFDPSFQLSALATLGLILFTPIVASRLTRVPERFGAREILASTCATQLMVAPLLLYQNGTLSLVSLPANLLALLPVPWAMFFSLIAGIGGELFGTSATVVSFPAYALLWYIVSIAHAFASLPFAAVSLPSFGTPWLFGCYAFLFAGYWCLKRKAATVRPPLEVR